MFKFLKAKKNNSFENVDPKISFKFEQIGSYYGTVVTIKARLPFQSLHLLYKLPLIILKAYWGKVFYGQMHSVSNNGVTVAEIYNDAAADEKLHISLIENIAKDADDIAYFPSQLKEKKTANPLTQ